MRTTPRSPVRSTTLRSCCNAGASWTRRSSFNNGAIQIVESVAGLESADLAQYLSNLASLERERGNLERAIELDTRALAIREDRLGPTHPDVADPLSGLAEAHEAQGDLERAQELDERALALRVAVFDPSHPAGRQRTGQPGAGPRPTRRRRCG